MSVIISRIYKSIIRSTADMIEEINASEIYGEVAYHDWESRGDENTLPSKTLIGLDGFSFDENRGLWLIRYALAISSYRDYNLLNEIEMIDVIHDHFGQGKKVALRNVVDGEEESELVCTEFQMLPMAQSEIRNYRTIGIELKRTGA